MAGQRALVWAVEATDSGGTDSEEDSDGSAEDGVASTGSSGSSRSSSSAAGRAPMQRRAARSSTWRQIITTTAQVRKGQKALREEHPQEWEEKVVVPNIKRGSKMMLAVGVVFFLSYEFKVICLMIFHQPCRRVAVEGSDLIQPLETPHRMLPSELLAVHDWLFWTSVVAMSACLWWPRRPLYELLLLTTLVVWQWRDLMEGASWICRRHIVLSECRVPLRGEPCRDCSHDGYVVMMDIMNWILLLATVVLDHTWMRTLLCLCVVWFWIASVFHEGAEEALAVRFSRCFDTFVGTVLFAVVSWVALRVKRQDEEEATVLFSLEVDEERATKGVFKLLTLMLPSFVIAPVLKEHTVADNIERCSIMFVLLDGFDAVARRLKPADLLKSLNRSFTKMDHICKARGVTKIETFKEEYVCAVGVVPEDVRADQADGHACILEKLVQAALDILATVPSTGEETALKVGIHTGPVLAGVVGNKLPRFRLFGDTVNTAARMMQKGLPGKVQFGQETFRELPGWASRAAQRRGEVMMKGKGLVTTFLLEADEREPNSDQQWGSRGALASEGQASNVARLSKFGLASALMGKIESRSGAVRALATSRPRYKRGAETREFQKVLSELEKQKLDSEPSGRGRCLHRRVSCWCPWSGYPAHLEEGFHDWYLREKTLKALSTRLNYALVLVPMLTALEFCYLLHGGKDVKNGSWQHAFDRLVVFLSCRLACLLILVVVREVAKEALETERDTGSAVDARGSWIRLIGWEAEAMTQGGGLGRARLFQGALVGAICAVAALLFVSYDSVHLDPWAFERNCTMHVGEPSPAAEGVSQDLVKLIFFPVYMLILWANQFLVAPSISFLVLTVVLIAGVHEAPGMGGLPLDRGGAEKMIAYTLIYLADSYFRELVARAQYKASCAVDLMHRRIDTTLEALMPPEVVKELQVRQNTTLSHWFESATLAQSDLVGFTQLASTCRPEEVVAVISELFGQFDLLTDTYEVFKVETVGDAYIAGQGGYPLTPGNSSLSVVQFAVAMVEAVLQWSRKRGESVSCRVGVHTGPCVGGIVGTDMQRYHLFGELMTCLEVLESTSAAGRVQVSRACKEAVDREAGGEQISVRFEARDGDVLMTSKHEAHSYEDAGGRPTFFVC